MSAGLPHRVRVWLQAELTEYVRAGVPDEEFRNARQFLESEHTAGFFANRPATDRRSEEQILNDMKALAVVVRRHFREKHFKVDPEPVE